MDVRWLICMELIFLRQYINAMGEYENLHIFTFQYYYMIENIVRVTSVSL